MIYKYPIIEGKEERHSFYSEWNEVPVTSFIAWSKIALELDEVNQKVIQLFSNLYNQSEKLQIEKLKKNDKNLIASLEKKVKITQGKLEPLLNKQKSLELEGVSLFCSVPVPALAQMERDVYLEGESGEMIEVEINDNHFQSYKNSFFLLSQQDLPDDEINEFYFQAETDELIKSLEMTYNSFGLIKRLSKRGKSLRRQIQSAKSTKFTIKDIWLQSTIANKEFQELANRIIKQFEKGDFSELILLVAMLTTESNQESEALEQMKKESAQTYLETYRDKFLEIYKNRVKLFSEQEKKLDIATMIRIKNFFLLSYKKSLRTSQAY